MPKKSEAAKREEAILAFWERERIFEKSLEKKPTKGDFIFYEVRPQRMENPASTISKAAPSKMLSRATRPCAGIG